MPLEAVVVDAGDNVPADESDEGAAPESLSDAELAAALGETETPETPAEEVEPEKVDEPVEPAAKPAPVSQEEFDKLKKKMENQELFLQRQGTEVGQLRKMREQLQNLAKEKRALAEEQLLTDPSKAMDTHAEARDVEKQVANAEIQEQFEANRQAIQTAFPDYEARVNDIAEAALEMGIPPEHIANYRANPYGTPVSILTPYVRAAVLRKHYFEKASLADKLVSQLKDLQTNTGTFAKKLKAAALTAPVIKSAGGSHTEGSDSVDEAQITDLSYAEIERLLKASK